MSITEKFSKSGEDANFDSALSLVTSGNADQVCRGLSQISALYCNGTFPYNSRMMDVVRGLPDKQQRIVAGATILGFRLNREFPGNLEYWAVHKLPEFNRRSITAVVNRIAFCRPVSSPAVALGT